MQQDFAWHLLVSLVTQAPGKTPGLISKPKDDDEIEACGQDSFFFFWGIFCQNLFLECTPRRLAVFQVDYACSLDCCEPSD